MSAVWRGFSQTALDAAYNNRAVEPGLAKIKQDWARRSEAVIASARMSRDLAYGPGPRQRLDFFHAAAPGRPTVAFIHGGYWQSNEKEPYAFIAESLLAQGLNVVLLEYTLAPQARIGAIVADIHAAVDWLAARLRSQFDAGPEFLVTGHSAGGHLTAMAAARSGVTAAMTISGLFDLEPIRLCYLNEAISMDITEAGANSPIRLTLPPTALSVAVGGAELPELVRQSRDYAAQLQAAGHRVRELILPGESHFSILEQLARPGGALLAEAMRLVGAGAA